MDTLGIGLTGTGWIADVHARALAQTPGAKVVATTSRDQGRGEAFASKHGIKQVYTDYRAMLEDKQLDLICVGLPNDQHEQVVLDAAAAGKHVICEKPLATNLEQGQRMVAACKDAGVMLALGVELCFVPKFMRTKELAESGAIGRIYHVHQREQHSGPHTPWFYTRDQAGGGSLMDLGCHSIEIIRHTLGYPKATSVYAHISNQLHTEIDVEDQCIVMVEFEGNITALIEASWALKGGMESHLNLFGTDGVIYTDLLQGTGMRMFSERGVPDNREDTTGWTMQDPDWLWNNGYPQEMANFLHCARTGDKPRVSGEDGLVQLEISYAAYHSAATGQRVQLPFRPEGVERAVDLWRPRT